MLSAVRTAGLSQPLAPVRFAGFSSPSLLQHARTRPIHSSGAATALRYFRQGRNLQRTRLFALAIAALLLEQQRRKAFTISDYNIAGSAKPVDKNLAARLKRFGLAARRVAVLAGLAMPVAVGAPVAYLTNGLFPALSEAVWEYSLWGIEVAGPTFIKLTQWASTRSDLFPAEFCLRFAKLQDA